LKTIATLYFSIKPSKIRFYITLTTFLFGLPFIGLSQNYDDIKKEIDKIIYLDSQLDLLEIPNVVIGVANGDSIYFYQYSFDEEKKADLNQSSVFEIGDLSKAFTGMICFWLARKGNISLSDSLRIHAEDRKTSVIFPATLEQILSHRSGLPMRPREFGLQEKSVKNPYADYTKSELINHFLNNEYSSDDARKFLFSQYGYALIEIYLEQNTQITFEKLARAFAQENGLKRTFVSTADSVEVIVGHDRTGKITPPGNYASFEAAEGFKSCAQDLLKIGSKSWKAPESWLWNSFASFWKMPNDKKMKVSTGWYVFKAKKFTDIILQSGSSEGHRSFLGFVPKTKTAVVVLTDSVKSQNGLGFLILKMLNKGWKHPEGKLK